MLDCALRFRTASAGTVRNFGMSGQVVCGFVFAATITNMSESVSQQQPQRQLQAPVPFLGPGFMAAATFFHSVQAAILGRGPLVWRRQEAVSSLFVPLIHMATAKEAFGSTA